MHPRANTSSTLANKRAHQKGTRSFFFAQQWWDYVERLPERCPLDGETAETGFGTECSYKLIADLGIDSAKIKQCVAATQNKKLESEKINQAWSPRALRVNGWRFNGMLSVDLVTRAICSGFFKAPPECDDLLEPRDPTGDYLGAHSASGMSGGMVVVALIFATVGIGCSIFAFRYFLPRSVNRQVKEQVMLEVQYQMDQYNKLES